MTITVDDYLSGTSQSAIDPADLIDRINSLRERVAAYAVHGDATDADDVEQRLAELDELRAFVDHVEARTGKRIDDACIVPESRFAWYVQDEAEQAGLIDKSLSIYLRWEDFARAHQGDGWTILHFGDDAVYVR